MTNIALLEPAPTSFHEPMNSGAIPLLAYWYTSRRCNPVPDRETFNPNALREWLGYISIYEYDPVRSDFTNRLEGTLISEMTGQNWTGRWASDVDRSFGSTFVEELLEVRSTATPSIESVRIYQKKYCTATKLLMPIAGKGRQDPSQVFLAMFPNR